VNINAIIVYSTLFSNGVEAFPQSIVVDSSGDAIVSGADANVGFPVTAGAYRNSSTANLFITKIDPTGTKLIFSAVGVGGQHCSRSLGQHRRSGHNRTAAEILLSVPDNPWCVSNDLHT
jgi:hypothetical protein